MQSHSNRSSSSSKETVSAPNNQRNDRTARDLKDFIGFANQVVHPIFETYSGNRVGQTPHGLGKMKYRNELGEVVFEFEGRFRNGKRIGRGTEKYPEGYYREIEYKNGVPHIGGMARIPFAGKVYTGHLTLKGKFVRNVTIIYPNHDQRESYYGRLDSKLQPQGAGTLKYRNGDFFKGLFFNDHPHDTGHGKVMLSNGTLYEGPLNNKLEPIKETGEKIQMEELPPLAIAESNKDKEPTNQTASRPLESEKETPKICITIFLNLNLRICSI